MRYRKLMQRVTFIVSELKIQNGFLRLSDCKTFTDYHFNYRNNYLAAIPSIIKVPA